MRTVRGYIRTGRRRAVRIGKQYRITHADLAALTGGGAPAGPPPAAEVSSIVRAAQTADLLHLLDAVLDGDNGLLARKESDGA